jgi:hypothetical protein
MASTYVNDLRLNEMATGDGSGTWGTTTNTNLELIAEAFSYGTEVITTNADTHTTTIADGATDPGRSLYLKYTGTLDSACTITIGPNTVSKVWIIENGTSGSQNIIISQGSGANITIPAGDTKVVYSDGAGAGAAFFDAFASLSVVDLKVQDDLTVTGDIDVDGTTNLDVVDIDGAVDMASTALVTGVLTANGGAVFNETGADVDFRVESDTVDHALFVQGSDGNVGIGTSSPLGKLSVGNGSLTDASLPIQISTSSDGGEAYLGVNRNGGYGALFGFAADATYKGLTIRNIVGNGTSNADGISFATNNTDVRMHIKGDGSVGIGTTSPDAALEVNSGGGIHLSDNTAGRTLIIKPSLSGAIHEFTSDNTSAGFAFSNDTSELLRIDSSGNLLVGTTSSQSGSKAVINGDIALQASLGTSGDAFPTLQFYNNNSTGFVNAGITATVGGTINSGNILFNTNNAGSYAERMRIDASGNLLVGTTTSVGGLGARVSIDSNTARGLAININTGSSRFEEFLFNGSTVGFISTNGVTTAYNTSSDYRLKEDDQPMTGATERVKALRPINFAWKVDGSRVDGFLAHEAQEVVPECVTGTKDAMMDEEYEVTPAVEEVRDEDGNVTTEAVAAVMGTRSVPDYQGIDQSKLVPLLLRHCKKLLLRLKT